MKKTLFAMVVPMMVILCGHTALAADDKLFTDFDGQPRSIESYAGGGKWLVVMVWAHDCGICNQEAPSYARFHEARKEVDARVLGLSIDGAAGKAEALAFIARHQLPFPNLLGEPEVAGLKYQMLTQEGLRGTPTFLLYGPDGELRAAQAGAVSIKALEAFIAKNG